jgi:glutathione synthase/RimK-type ligase-like ATP-grasp enzyme
LYVEFIPNEREYRLHVIGGMVVSVQRKYLERPHLSEGGFVKNHAHGYVFKTPERGLNASRHRAAIQAVELLGLDFGAVDMVVDHEGKEYVLEVNTAPALSPKRIEQYVTALRPLLDARA